MIIKYAPRFWQTICSIAVLGPHSSDPLRRLNVEKVPAGADTFKVEAIILEVYLYSFATSGCVELIAARALTRV